MFTFRPKKLVRSRSLQLESLENRKLLSADNTWLYGETNYQSYQLQNSNSLYNTETESGLITSCIDGAYQATLYQTYSSQFAVNDSSSTDIVTKTGTYRETLAVQWNYTNAGWTITAVTGTGSGTYESLWHSETTADYSRNFYNSTITGSETVSFDRVRNEKWSVNYVLINGIIAAESSGTITETYQQSLQYAGSGSVFITSTESTPLTLANYTVGTHSGSRTLGDFIGTQTTFSEKSYSLTEVGSQDYYEITVTNWNKTADERGVLQYSASAKADITTASAGSYDFRLYEYSSNLYEAVLDEHRITRIGSLLTQEFDADGTKRTFTDSEKITELSESFQASSSETRTAQSGVNGGAFALVSSTGSTSGQGRSFSGTYSSDYSDTSAIWHQRTTTFANTESSSSGHTASLSSTTRQEE
ncbi:MAG: hypothetical protein LBT89_06775, partial [Planctomycetaceae bacterium]|nr:hypothetical protein [Planctomycetaceae bacterium]